MDKLFVGIVIAVIGAGVFVFMGLLYALPVMWLWNLLMPHLFELPAIDFWEALGIVVLSGLLFKSQTSNSKVK
jgi:hypothetical protein